MKILVTGGAGFIGRHVVEDLLNNNQVRIFDNFSNSDKELISKLSNLGAEVINGDITNQEDIVSASKDFEIIIHLAAIISVEESVRNPKKTFEINIEGTKNVLNACKINNIKKLIVASSSAVYGESKPNQQLNENSKLNPISPYGESKLKMELEIKDFTTKNKINVIILRFFNIFGLGQSPEYAGVITKFMEKIQNNQALEIFGDGKQTRDFVSINDIVSAIKNSITTKNEGTFNIASGKSITIEELAKKMIDFSGKKLSVEFLPIRKGDIKFSQVDISLAQNMLNYSPKYGLEEIKKMIK